MRIVCPHCAAAYDVAPQLLSGRRTVRCAKCHESWDVAAPASDISEPARPPRPPAVSMPADLDPTVVVAPSTRDLARDALARDALARDGLARDGLARDGLAHDDWLHDGRPRRATGTRAVWLGWVASIVILAAALGGAVAWRADIMHAWPPSTRVYSALHLAG